MPTMTARQAADRMGVKLETLYAYVSRGVLHRDTAADGRTSVFDSREVEALALRGRPRQSSRSTSIDMLIETRLTELTPQGVRYRGRWAADLAVSHTFEQVAELLWLGTLPDAHQPWTAVPLRSLPVAPPQEGLIGAMQVTVAVAGAADPGSSGLDAPSVAACGRRLIATVVDSLPVAGDGRAPRLTIGHERPVRSTIAGRLWARLSPRRPSPGMLLALNAALVLLADHDLATSTFGVRVAASTRADPYAAVSAGLGVLRGPLHGGASVLARALLDDAADVGAPRAVGALLAAGKRVPGFGHKVYVGADPRAALLLDLLREVPGARRTAHLVDEVCRVTFDRTGAAPNVDIALAALGAANNMSHDAGEAVMATARIAGWLAHAIEEYAEAPLRFRPRAHYLGP
jgi:citrate synthase